MMTHGESAAQASRGILLANFAPSTQRWRSWPHPSLRDITPIVPYRKGGNREKAGRRGKRRIGRERAAGRQNKSNLLI